MLVRMMCKVFMFMCMVQGNLSCRTSPLRAGRSLRDGYTRFASLLLLVGTEFDCEHRGHHAQRSLTTKWSPRA